MPSTTPKDLTMQTRDFHLPPARAPPSLQPLHHLSQRLLPNPSDLIVHGAISAFNNEALLSPSPKQTWLQTGEDANSLIARYTSDTTEDLNNFAHSLRSKPGDKVVILDSGILLQPTIFANNNDRLGHCTP